MKALAETDSDSDDDDFDLLAFRKIVLGYLEKKESVTKAIKRLSENVKKAKKAGDIELMEDEQHSCNKLMDYVNQFVDQGHYDIYQETYESLTAKVNPILTSATSDDRKRNPDDDDLSLPKAKQVKFDSSVNKDDLEDMFKWFFGLESQFWNRWCFPRQRDVTPVWKGTREVSKQQSVRTNRTN